MSTHRTALRMISARILRTPLLARGEYPYRVLEREKKKKKNPDVFQVKADVIFAVTLIVVQLTMPLRMTISWATPMDARRPTRTMLSVRRLLLRSAHKPLILRAIRGARLKFWRVGVPTWFYTYSPLGEGPTPLLQLVNLLGQSEAVCWRNVRGPYPCFILNISAATSCMNPNLW